MNTLNARTRFTADLRDWLTAVEAIKPAIINRPADAPEHPVLGRVRITWGDGGAELTATTFSTSIRFRITGETGYYGIGATVLDYRDLARTLATYGTKTTNRRITVSCDLDGSDVALGDDQLTSSAPDSFPVPVELGGHWHRLAWVERSGFTRLIKHTGRAVGRKDQFDVLGLMRLSADAGTGLFRAESTDRFRLVRGHADTGFNCNFSKAVQGRTLRDAARYVDGDMIGVHAATGGYVVISSDRIDVALAEEIDLLPDFAPKLASAAEGKPTLLTVDRRELLEETERAIRSEKAATKDTVVMLHRDRDYVFVESVSPTAARSIVEPLRAVVWGEPPSRVRINGKYLADALKAFQGRNVTLCFLGEGEPITVIEEGQALGRLTEGYHVQFMPMHERNGGAA